MSQSNYDLKFTPIAEKDLDEIYSYISNVLFAKVAANELMTKMETEIMRLKQFPFSCSYVSDELLKGRGYRKLIVDNYIVFYLVNELEKQVVVMRIIYSARDYGNLV